MVSRRTLRDLPELELRERRALVRVDYNVPLAPDGAVGDPGRVEATVPTLRYLLEVEARPILLSHLGRPGGAPDPRCSLAPVVPVLSQAAGAPVRFAGPADSEEALQASRDLPAGSILLLENTRFLAGETRNDEELSRRFARLGDLFVQDAFGSTHRAHASTVGVARFLRPAVAGLLVEAELRALDALLGEVERPFVVAFGGAKIADKIEVLEGLAHRADAILVGGAMANTFLAARGVGLGRSMVEEESLDVARDLLARWEPRTRLPTDLLAGDAEAGGRDPVVVPADAVPEDRAALDIGPRTRETYAELVRQGRTFFWNGPMGLFEHEAYAEGTRTVARAAAEATLSGAFTVVGGGDSARAVREAGLSASVSHVSTGGGAALEYLARGSLPGVDALDPAS